MSKASAKKSKKNKSKKDKKKKRYAESAALAALPPPSLYERDQSIMASPLGANGQHRQLDLARARWEHGDWAALLELEPAALEADPDRANLALILAAAHSHAGESDRARHLARQAMLWGASRVLTARVLLSAAQNSLARVAAALEEDPTPHFEAAIRLVQPHADAPLLSRSRRVRELARMGLLPEAAKVLEEELGLLKANASDITDTSIQILEGKVDLLKHELALSLSRNQLHQNDAKNKTSDLLDREYLKSKSVSQLGQDLWVLEKSNYKRGGYFVEFGATDGILLSNSYLLEKHFGWTGLCAEPNPQYFKDLKNNRTCVVSDACIGSATGKEVEFVLADEFGTMSEYADVDDHAERREAFQSLNRVIHVRTISLADFLIAHNAPHEIDYLSIDTEGSEFDILQAFPFDQWKIRLISVEHNYTEMRGKLAKLLQGYGYTKTEAQWDDWYELKL